MLSDLIVVISLVVFPLSTIYFYTDLEDVLLLNYSKSLCLAVLDWILSSPYNYTIDRHLKNNMENYTIIVIIVYLTLTYFENRKVFYVCFGVFLTIGAVVTQISSFVWATEFAGVNYEHYDGGGFSGVVTAFSGLLILAVLYATWRLIKEEKEDGLLSAIQWDENKSPIIVGLFFAGVISASILRHMLFPETMVVEGSQGGQVDLGSHWGGAIFGFVFGLIFYGWQNIDTRIDSR